MQNILLLAGQVLEGIKTFERSKTYFKGKSSLGIAAWKALREILLQKPIDKMNGNRQIYHLLASVLNILKCF